MLFMGLWPRHLTIMLDYGHEAKTTNEWGPLHDNCAI
jgi:hypothetical protein